MQFQETIKIDLPTIQAIKVNSKNKIKLLENLLEEQKDKIIRVLNSYDHFDGTLGEVHDCDIDEDSIRINKKGIGEFRVDFQVYYYFGCADIDKEYEQEMNFIIEVNLNNQDAEIIGEVWDERQEDDF